MSQRSNELQRSRSEDAGCAACGVTWEVPAVDDDRDRRVGLLSAPVIVLATRFAQEGWRSDKGEHQQGLRAVDGGALRPWALRDDEAAALPSGEVRRCRVRGEWRRCSPKGSERWSAGAEYPHNTTKSQHNECGSPRVVLGSNHEDTLDRKTIHKVSILSVSSGHHMTFPAANDAGTC